jgi:iron complex outermembrane recepter protein
VDNLTLSAWGAWSTAELTEDLPVGAGLPLGFTGDRLPLSSRVSGSLSADREFSMTPEVSTSVGASVTYIGDRLGLFATNGVRTTYPDYIKVDLRARFMYRSWTAMLYANNITNKHTVLSGGPGFFPPSSSSIVQPRTIGLGVTRTF